MLNKEILVKDLNYICEQTNAQWFCASDLYTPDILKDEKTICKLFWDAGFLKKDILNRGFATLEYGGGLSFNLKDVGQGGYVIPVREKYKAPLVFSGFETNYDQHTIYHECAHLYQRKFSLFKNEERATKGYGKYLKEIHANTFASMVMLLRAKDVLDFKKQQLYCLAHDVGNINQKNRESKFYMSLPIVLELIKAVRREGREKTVQKFSKNGNLDFEKIAFYTANLVQKYAYTPIAFFNIMNDNPVSSYEILKKKAKSWHILGSKYINTEYQKYQKRIDDYELIYHQRKCQTDQKIKKLPEVDETAKIINAVCAIDILNTRLSQDFNVYADLEDVMKKNIFYFLNIRGEKKKEALKICEDVADIHQKWHKNRFFKKLFSKINHPDTRDEVWNLKFKKEKEIYQNLQLHNIR